MNRIVKRSIIGLLGLLVCSTVILFTFHEGAQSALDKAVKNAQESISNKLGESGGSSDSTDRGPSRAPAKVSDLGTVNQNATFFTLCQNKDVSEMVRSVRSVENKFNSKFHYDWVFLNNDDFDDRFKEKMKEHVSGNVYFGKLDNDVWGPPDWIDLDKAADTRKWMRDHNVRYGELESYHNMCRFQAGYFFRHPLLQQYKYAWRVEPGIQILCKPKEDPFLLMHTNQYIYGFNVAPQDIRESITTLWDSTKKYLSQNESMIHKDSLKNFISDNENLEHYNLCHFWTNFEISDMDWLRSDDYLNYFNFLDKEGGFYYERWGDAPIRSIAASLFLPKDKIHFFNDIGYYHAPYGHCPYDQGPLELECDCHPKDTEFSNKFYDYHKNSCMRRYFKAKGRTTYHDPNPDEKD